MSIFLIKTQVSRCFSWNARQTELRYAVDLTGGGRSSAMSRSDVDEQMSRNGDLGPLSSAPPAKRAASRGAPGWSTDQTKVAICLRRIRIFRQLICVFRDLSLG